MLPTSYSLYSLVAMASFWNGIPSLDYLDNREIPRTDSSVAFSDALILINNKK